MAKKITAVVKLQLPAGKATPGPPVGSTLGPHGINIAGFTKEFNEKTSKDAGLIIPVIITIIKTTLSHLCLKHRPRPFLSRRHAVCKAHRQSPTRRKSQLLPKSNLGKSLL